MKIRGNNKGFTLTEVLIAVAILSIAIVPMLANFVNSSRVNFKSKRTMNGTIVAQNIMEGINAYGVESTIIQLENVDAGHVPDLKFMPSSMRVANWGRCTYEVDNSLINTEGKHVKVPKYVQDTYQDNTRSYVYDDSGATVNFQDTIKMRDREPGVYKEAGGVDTTDLNPAFSPKYIYSARGNVYFIDDKRKEALMDTEDYAHAYMFWLRGVEYGTKKYDVLLTMDANYYRDYAANLLDTTEANVSNMTSDVLQAKIANSSDPQSFNNKRTYNDEMLSRITSHTGTNASIDDTTPDRFYVNSDSEFDVAVSDFVTRCKPGTTREQIMAALQREINIRVRQETNPGDSSKPYRVITVEHKFELTDTSLLDPISFSSTPTLAFKDVAEEEIFRSSEKIPRNIYIYYIPNYEGNSASAPRDIINIQNDGEVDASGANYGTDMNLFLVRQTKVKTDDPNEDSALITKLSTDENNYKVAVNLTENLVSNDLRNVNTHIFTNIGYSLYDNSLKSGMGAYKVNSMPISQQDVTDKMRVGGLNGINRKEGSTQKDYIYEVTVQVFEPERNFEPEARIAKFTGSSN